MTETQNQHPLQGVRDQYDKLCAQRDAKYAKVQRLEDELARVNAERDALRVKAGEIAAQIDRELGGSAWLQLKKQIAALARALSAPNGILAQQ